MLLSKELKMSRVVILCTILISLLIVGCRQSPTPEPLKTATLEPSAADLPALNGEWKIKMTQSGGIMGLMRSIEISWNGKFSVDDERTGQTIAGEFSSGDLSKISEMVSSAKYVPASQPDGMGCADCFIYDLEIEGEGRKFTAQLNDVSLPNSGLEPVITYLRTLIDTNLR
jgi:hypothetical protein